MSITDELRKEARGFGGELREEIVRCKDCKHYIDHARVIATDVEHICTFWNGGNGVKVEPDGFCKWGERRADHD